MKAWTLQLGIQPAGKRGKLEEYPRDLEQMRKRARKGKKEFYLYHVSRGEVEKNDEL
jgi:hypothetical protein